MLCGVNNARRAGARRAKSEEDRHELVTCVSVESVLEWLPVYPHLATMQVFVPEIAPPVAWPVDWYLYKIPVTYRLTGGPRVLLDYLLAATSPGPPPKRGQPYSNVRRRRRRVFLVVYMEAVSNSIDH